VAISFLVESTDLSEAILTRPDYADALLARKIIYSRKAEMAKAAADSAKQKASEEER